MNAAIEQTEGQATELDSIVDVFQVAEMKPAARGHQQTARSAARPAPRPASGQAARAYLTQGNAAVDLDWSEF
jgi:methyl-accepting chemotaxis protein